MRFENNRKSTMRAIQLFPVRWKLFIGTIINTGSISFYLWQELTTIRVIH